MVKRKNNLFKSSISILLSFLLLLNAANIAVYAESNEDGVLRVTNSFVQYSVAAENGRFSIKTDEGVPFKEDEKSRLLFEENKPETSFATFRIDGEDYIYGNNYGFLNLGGVFTSTPRILGKVNTSTWAIGTVHITQRLELLEDADNPSVGNVRITYEVENKDSSNKSIGVRMLLDTMLGSNDGAPITIAGSQSPITKEIKLEGKDIPQYWRSIDNLFAPAVISYGFTQGWGNLSPDEMLIGHWNGLSETKWDYSADAAMDFTKTDNRYGSADSAVALYWKPISIGPGEKKVFETYYGIGNFQNVNDGAKFSINLNAPEKLVLNERKTGYVEDTFEIIAEIDNTLSDASNLTNVTASLILGEGLELTEGQVPYISKDVIKRNELHTFKWEVRAQNSSSYVSRQFRVDISSDNSTEPVSKGKYIIIPGTAGEPPVIQFQNVTPGKLYYQGMKTFTIKGKGYDVYESTGLWKMLLINDQTKETVQILRDNIIVKEDSITASLDNNLEKGKYSIRLQHDYADIGDKLLPHKLEMTDDGRFKSRSYGILYIKKAKVEGEWQYTIETAEDEERLKQIEDGLAAGEDIIMKIKGDIRTTEEGGNTVYRAYSEAEKTVINSVLQYSGQPLVIQKVDDTAAVDGIDTVSITGDGTLTLENGFSFWWWDFEINITDEENYVKEFADEENEESNVEVEFTGIGKVLKWVAGFAIEIENAVILESGVSFGGSIELPIPFGKDKEKDKESDSSESGGDEEEEDESGFKADISKVLFGMEDEEFGFIGIDSETELKMPKDLIPISWIQDGFEAKLTINTIDDIYGIEGQVNIKIVEAYINLTFMKNQSTGNYLPDDIVLAGGYEPGVPVGPTGIFITKVGGGVEDLYGTLTGDSSLPPLQVILMTAIDFAKVIKLDAKLSISKEGFLLEGEGEIAKIKALEEVRVGLRWARPISLDLAAKLSLFEIIEGEVSLHIGEDKWEGIVSATVSVPDDVFLVGGQELLGAEFGANNKKIWGTVKIIRIPVGLTYYWGKGVDFDVASAGNYMPTVMGSGIYSTTLREEDGDDMLMVVGSNIKRLGTSKTYYAALGKEYREGLVLAAAGDQEHFMNILDQKIALMEFKYTGDKPNIQVFRPDGDEYQLIGLDSSSGDPNMLYQEIQAESSSTGELEQYVYISIVEPENGQWRIVSDKPVISGLMDVKPAPGFNSISVNGIEENKYNVEWNAEYAEGSTVDIYLAKGPDEAGLQLVQGIDGALGHQEVSVPAGVEEGDYYIRATIEKSDFGYDSIYTDTMVHVVDPHKPGEVTGVNMEPYGDGLLKVDWEAAGEEGINGYIITVYDKDGNIIESIGHQFTDADDRSILLGGQYQLQGSDEKGGLKPRAEYRVGIVTSRKVGTDESYTMHYSDTAYSGTVYLPEPDPAVIDIQLDESFVDGYNNEGIMTKISNKDKVTLTFSADQSNVSTEVLVNGVFLKEAEGNAFEAVIPAEDGSYNVEFVTVNGSGDTSSKTVNFTIDRTAPLLMISSPVQGQLSEEGEILVKGIGEKSATITVNGLSAVIDSNGNFEKSLSFGDSLKQKITIEATDKANNITRYETEVVNDTVKAIDRIYVRPVVKELNAGDSQDFEAIAVDDKGREISISDGVEWSLLEGQSLAEVNADGRLQTISNGDLILKAAYYISEDYSFDDAISIRVLPKTDIIDDGGTPDDGDDGGTPDDGDGSGAPDDGDGSGAPDDGDDNGGAPDADRNDNINSGRRNNNSSNDKYVDRELEKILANIIGSEQDIEIVNTFDVDAGQPNTVFISNDARISIPGNSVGQKDKLLVGIVEDNRNYINENDRDRKLLSPIYELQFVRSNNSFREPLRLTFKYDKSKINDISKVGIYYFNESFGKWQYLGGKADISTGEISVNIDHFSKYTLMEDAGMLNFTDIKGRWSENYIKGLYSLGVVSGIEYGKGYKYEPARNISRLEFTKLVVEAMLNTGGISSVQDNSELPFADKAKIPAWGRKYAALAFKHDIVKGKGTKNGYVFDGDAPITKAEAATIIGRTLEELGDTKISFADKNQMPSWAKDYIGALVNKKIIKGNPDNTFKPNNNLTREEAASIISNWLH
ncbi:MAG TPA: S-layer homology domain-containing protein [Clostridia bacterium]|nr:S-layer homology domain-containing protein [Clostridia bacterium]